LHVLWCIARARKLRFPGPSRGVDEMLGIGRALAEAGHGVFEIITDVTGPDADLQWLADLTIETGRPISLAALISGRSGMRMGEVLELIRRAVGWCRRLRRGPRPR
jgi:N-acyl-D-amino-acid deacylase